MVGIVTALGFEARALGSGSPFTVRRCGVGGPALASAVRELHEQGCGLIVSWGTAGALSPRFKAGDLHVAEQVLTRHGTRLASDTHWRRRFSVAAGRVCTIRSGTLLDSTQIVAAPAEKRRLFASTGADALDMESGPVAEACITLGLPFLAIRSIIDEAHDRLPERLESYVGANGSLRGTALAAALVLSPRQWLLLPRLARRYRRANRTLSLAASALASCAREEPRP
ncbi:MAG: hypothetical protein WB783_06525 [Arenicellales bacterium]